jgi:hypothetical protein
MIRAGRHLFNAGDSFEEAEEQFWFLPSRSCCFVLLSQAPRDVESPAWHYFVTFIGDRSKQSPNAD